MVPRQSHQSGSQIWFVFLAYSFCKTYTITHNLFQAFRNATVMIEFALAMWQILEQLNRDSFQNFELRIGLESFKKMNCIGMSVGPLVAGVIGAQKPQYDIWGNTVNLASRMDTHGEPRKIHVIITFFEIDVDLGHN